MARHPLSENLPFGSDHVRSSHEIQLDEEEKEDAESGPILSLSKSSMDIVMSRGMPILRDPAWERLNLRRSASHHSHTSPIAPNIKALQQVFIQTPQHKQKLQHTNSFLPKKLSQQGHAQCENCNVCSGSVCSASSTPDTVIWKEGTSQACSHTEPALCSPEFPFSRQAYAPVNGPPFISPLQTPMASPSHTQICVSSPLLLPQQKHTTILPMSNSVCSGTNVEETGRFGGSLQDAECIEEGTNGDRTTRLFANPSDTHFQGGLSGSLVEAKDCKTHVPFEKLQKIGRVSRHHTDLTWLSTNCLSTSSSSQYQGSEFTSSLSDSQVDGGFFKYGHAKVDGASFVTSAQLCQGREGSTCKEKGTMTSKMELKDMAVQVGSPFGSIGNLGRHLGSYMGSHSILGSPPGSRLNLRSSVGSHSNLVSPSSSMFRMDSSGDEEGNGEGEDEVVWKVSTPPPAPGGRRRSCLKVQTEEGRRSGGRDYTRRRSSMKQVQWDEDGMTWDVHGASLDPEELSSAIQKHLQMKTNKAREKNIRKKTKTTKIMSPATVTETPPTIPETSAPAEQFTSVETEAGPAVKYSLEREGFVEQKAPKVEGGGGGKDRGLLEKHDSANEREEGGTQTSNSRSPSLERKRIQRRRRSVMRSLKKPGCCVRSSKACD